MGGGANAFISHQNTRDAHCRLQLYDEQGSSFNKATIVDDLRQHCFPRIDSWCDGGRIDRVHAVECSRTFGIVDVSNVPCLALGVLFEESAPVASQAHLLS